MKGILPLVASHVQMNRVCAPLFLSVLCMNPEGFDNDVAAEKYLLEADEAWQEGRIQWAEYQQRLALHSRLTGDFSQLSQHAS